MRSQAAVGRRHEEAAVCHGEERQGKQSVRQKACLFRIEGWHLSQLGQP